MGLLDPRPTMRKRQRRSADGSLTIVRRLADGVGTFTAECKDIALGVIVKDGNSRYVRVPPHWPIDAKVVVIIEEAKP